MPARRLLLATTNPGKVREIRLILDGAPVELLALTELDAIEAPEETGLTFADNALLKARYYGSATGLRTVAEDSGLAIDALGGRPGVASARYPGATYAARFERLYRELSPHSRPWTARFVCSVAVVSADGTVEFTTEATVEGEIAPEPRGTNGFGYDPIFFFPPYGETLGEVDDARKLAVAHRGKAFRTLRARLMAEGSDASPF